MNSTKPHQANRPSVLITSYGGDWLAGEPSQRYSFAMISSENTSDNNNHSNYQDYTSRGVKQEARETHDLGDGTSKRAEILSPRGSVRGHRDIVRISLDNIKSSSSGGRHFGGGLKLSSFAASAIARMNNQQLYLERLASSERNSCVIYTTSLGVIRRTFEDSKLMRWVTAKHNHEYDAL